MMNKEKQIEEMQVDLMQNLVFSDNGVKCGDSAINLYAKGYRKASEIAREVAYDFQNRLRHIFLDMCNYNDYDTLNLLQIDSAIEALYDTFIAELKKKYTEGE